MNNSKSIKAWLTRLFCIISFPIFIMIAFTLIAALEWAESETAKQRISIYEKEAIAYFTKNTHENTLEAEEDTKIYNDISLVPEEFRHHFEGKTQVFKEVNGRITGKNYFLNLSEYEHNNEKHKIYILWPVYEIRQYLLVSHVPVIIIILLFVLLFGISALLWSLYKRLFAPIHLIKTQLDESQGNPKYTFEIPENSFIEFQDLINQLNNNNFQIDSLIKREQAFARYASHELRTPLTSIIGSNALLEKSEHSEFQARQITRIKNSSKQMSSIVDLLLSLVRYEKNTVEDIMRQITKEELDKIISNQLEQSSMLSLPTDKKVSINLEISNNPYIKAPEIVVDVIIGNLIKNALVATKANENSPKIIITLAENSIIVQDNGNGLNQESTGKQNIKFLLEDNEKPQSLPSHGFGLGLLIVNELCQRYSWKFTLENQVCGGCIAKIEFPLLSDLHG